MRSHSESTMSSSESIEVVPIQTFLLQSPESIERTRFCGSRNSRSQEGGAS